MAESTSVQSGILHLVLHRHFRVCITVSKPYFQPTATRIDMTHKEVYGTMCITHTSTRQQQLDQNPDVRVKDQTRCTTTNEENQIKKYTRGNQDHCIAKETINNLNVT
jgi:hypothetical protein